MEDMVWEHQGDLGQRVPPGGDTVPLMVAARIPDGGGGTDPSDGGGTDPWWWLQGPAGGDLSQEAPSLW